MRNMPIDVGHYLTDEQLHSLKVAMLIKHHFEVTFIDLSSIAVTIVLIALISVDHPCISV